MGATRGTRRHQSNSVPAAMTTSRHSSNAKTGQCAANTSTKRLPTTQSQLLRRNVTYSVVHAVAITLSAAG